MPLYVLCIGAHPDDCDGSVGGTAALFRRRGDVVRFVSVTNGDKGHFAEEYRRDPSLLAARRDAEARSAAGRLGIEYRCLGFRDGELYVTPEATRAVVKAIRCFGPSALGPDLVLTNRPCDYHRDHRYTAQLVLDAAYALTVPLLFPESPALRRMPVVAYWHDSFTEDGVFRADVAVPIGDTLDDKIDMMAAHVSQFREWIPYNAGVHSVFADMPDDDAGLRDRLGLWMRADGEAAAAASRAFLPSAVRYAEAFQLSEYGRRPELSEIAALFPGGIAAHSE